MRMGWLSVVLVMGLATAVAGEQPLLTGTIKSLDDVKLSFPVAGRLEGVLAKEGQTVKAGDVILHLDKSQEEFEVQRRQVVFNDRAKVEEAVSKERVLKVQVDQARQLFASNTISRKQLEDEELSYNTAAADRKALEAAKKRERIELDAARESLSRRYLRAPMNGVIVKLYFQIGESVGIHEPAVRLVDVSRVYFTGNFDGKWASVIKMGDKVKVRVGTDATSPPRLGTVVFVSPVADLASGLVEIKVEIDNQDGTIRPGVSGQLLLAEGEG
ncbi:MAG: efflux RND transporter periplasmic adaptor subunit [Magnetococcales bacterium]|nr:efflux RND transporter periplasmic adaptor subunit [Magnetococcales bacterium]NGZ27382.1 efflux RND transporter periplasmic adaptor subunit [Magnetococcales bacterium]